MCKSYQLHKPTLFSAGKIGFRPERLFGDTSLDPWRPAGEIRKLKLRERREARDEGGTGRGDSPTSLRMVDISTTHRPESILVQ